jgi:MFS family permease
VRRLLLFASSVVLVETMFFAALGPLLPELRDELELVKWQAGLLVASYALGGIVGAIPSGLVATRFGVRRTVIAGLLALAVASAAFGLVDGYWPLVLTRFAQGLAGTLCWTGALAWVISAGPRERRGELIGIVMSAAIGGALLGPVLGGVASHVGQLACFGGIAALALVLAAWGLAIPSPAGGEPQPLRLLLVALRRRPVVVGMWLLTIPSLLFGALSVLGPLQLDDVGWGVAGIAATFVVSACLEAGASPLVGRWSDRRGRLAPLRVGLIASAAAMLTIPWLDGRWALSAVIVLAGVAFGMFWTPSMAMLSDGIESAGVGYALGFALMNFAWAPGNVIGTAAGGALAGAAGDAATYGILAAVCGITLLALRAGSPVAAAMRVQPAEQL